ncbi:unknown protein [Seminavis robusta]|uniref:Uncharacterized protein n=1 Tax=Seminavis robusta TaxID=568900 RepID=A0A9N8E0Z5_9STRA|nr:unknown protein [Seminavis robusta]|eukprot:Sro439_g143310.1 n/a (317) ;mRNA; f:61267-62217
MIDDKPQSDAAVVVDSHVSKVVDPESDLDLESTPQLEEDAGPGSCRTRCCTEWGSAYYPGWFSIHEGQKTVDVPASFGPTLVGSGHQYLFLWFDLLRVASKVSHSDTAAFFLAYLTHWGMIIASLYFLMSFINSIMPPKQPSNHSDSVSLWVKISWIMFEVAANLTFLVTLMWWSFQYKPGDTEVTFERVYMHGVVMVFVWVEGLVINRTPVRLKHLPLYMLIAGIYEAWLVIHQLATDIGDPTRSDNDPTTDDDLLYTAINFEDTPVHSSILMAMVLFLFVPLVHCLLWAASVWSCPCSYSGLNRRYISVNSGSD